MKNKRYFKIEGILEIPDIDWNIDKINNEFVRMLTNKTDLKFTGELKEITEDE